MLKAGGTSPDSSYTNGSMHRTTGDCLLGPGASGWVSHSSKALSQSETPSLTHQLFHP